MDRPRCPRRTHLHAPEGSQIGKINVTDMVTYVAVSQDIADQAVKKLSAGKVKGKKVKVRRI